MVQKIVRTTWECEICGKEFAHNKKRDAEQCEEQGTPEMLEKETVIRYKQYNEKIITAVIIGREVERETHVPVYIVIDVEGHAALADVYEEEIVEVLDAEEEPVE